MVWKESSCEFNFWMSRATDINHRYINSQKVRYKLRNPTPHGRAPLTLCWYQKSRFASFYTAQNTPNQLSLLYFWISEFGFPLIQLEKIVFQFENFCVHGLFIWNFLKSTCLKNWFFVNRSSMWKFNSDFKKCPVCEDKNIKVYDQISNQLLSFRLVYPVLTVPLSG